MGFGCILQDSSTRAKTQMTGNATFFRGRIFFFFLGRGRSHHVFEASKFVLEWSEHRSRSLIIGLKTTSAPDFTLAVANCHLEGDRHNPPQFPEPHDKNSLSPKICLKIIQATRTSSNNGYHRSNRWSNTFHDTRVSVVWFVVTLTVTNLTMCASIYSLVLTESGSPARFLTVIFFDILFSKTTSRVLNRFNWKDLLCHLR